MSKYNPECWNITSEEYAQTISPLVAEEYVPDIIERLDLHPWHRVADIGAGAGAVAKHVAPLVKNVTCVDYSSGMIEQLNEAMAGLGITNVEGLVGDGMDLSPAGISPQSFHRVTSNFALMLFDDLAKGAEEMFRALRPGGRAVVSVWSKLAKFELFGTFIQAAAQTAPELLEGAPPRVFALADISEFEALMTQAGFIDVKIEEVTHELVVEPQLAWNMLVQSIPPAAEFIAALGVGGYDPDKVYEMWDAFERILREKCSSGPCTFRNTANIAVGIKPDV